MEELGLPGPACLGGLVSPGVWGGEGVGGPPVQRLFWSLGHFRLRVNSAVFCALEKHWPLPLTSGRSNFLELDFSLCGWILEFILSLLLLEYRKATTNMPFLEHCKCSVINKSMVSFALNPLKYPDYLKLTSGTGDTADPGSACLACKNPMFSPQHYRNNKQITYGNSNHGAYMYSILTT